jgi:hypothetical protein
MAKRMAILILALTITACGSPQALTGATSSRLSTADYQGAMERAARFVEPGGTVAPAYSEQLRDEPPTGRELGLTANEAARLLGGCR